MVEYTTRDILLQNSDGENLNPYVNKLGNSTVGSSTQPIYLDNGSPAQCDVLSNADLSNLSTIGEAHFANPDLSNLSASGEAKVMRTLPTGVILPYGGTTAPDGFLLCNGGAISRTTYADLFAVIGTMYGSGDGSTTYNLPNYTDRVPQGMGTGYVNAGLPSIAHSHYIAKCSNRGTLGVWSANGGRLIDIYNYSTENTIYTSGIAQTLSSIYGASTTVQPPATKSNFIIKY